MIRIFIAEDDPIVLMGFVSMIRMLGYSICGTADDGSLAVSGILDTDPDIVLMDINMPKMDGLTAASEIMKKKKYPIIFVTGYHDENYIKRGTEVGAYYYLQKPVDEFDLKSAISIALARYGDHQKLSDNLKDVSIELDEAKQALIDRKIIERAKGILMDKFDMSEDKAFKYLQKKSQNKNIKIVEAAKGIIDADQSFDF